MRSSNALTYKNMFPGFGFVLVTQFWLGSPLSAEAGLFHIFLPAFSGDQRLHPCCDCRKLWDVSLLSKTMSRRKILRYSWCRDTWLVLECQHKGFLEGEEETCFSLNHYIWILNAIKYIYICTDDILNTIKFMKKCIFAEFFCVYT